MDCISDVVGGEEGARVWIDIMLRLRVIHQKLMLSLMQTVHLSKEGAGSK